ncbi:MAG: hypothetical protein AAF720_09285 [Pseudomonadota bacterium]
MRKELILHIGMHKCGSTAIQFALDGYDKDGIRYAALSAPNHGYLLKRVFNPSGITKPIVDIPNNDRNAANQRDQSVLRRELKKEGVRKLIISGETIPLLGRDGLLEFKRLANEFVDKFTLVAYIREPISFISSMTQQLVRAGFTLKQPPLPRYRFKFEPIIEIFGQENLIFRKFDRESLLAGSVVSDFCKICGISAGDIKDITANDRSSLEVIQLVNAFNEYGVFNINQLPFTHARDQMCAFLDQYFSSPFEMDRDIITNQIDWEDVQWMEKIAGFDLAKAPAGGWLRTISLQQFLENIEPATIHRLEIILKDLSIPHGLDEMPSKLMERLYAYFLSLAFPDAGMVDDLRDIALKLDRDGSPLENAQKLMRIAAHLRPTGAFIAKKKSEFDRRLSERSKE